MIYEGLRIEDGTFLKLGHVEALYRLCHDNGYDDVAVWNMPGPGGLDDALLVSCDPNPPDGRSEVQWLLDGEGMAAASTRVVAE